MFSMETLRWIRDVSGALTVAIPLSLAFFALLNRHRSGQHADHCDSIFHESGERIHGKVEDARKEIDRRLKEWLDKYGTYEWPSTLLSSPSRKSKSKVSMLTASPEIITPVGRGESGWIVKINRRKER